MDGARGGAGCEAGSDLEALGGGNAEHSVGEHGLELVEGRLAETDGDVADDAGDGAADAVVAVLEFGDQLDHLVGDGLVGAADGEELVDGLAGDVVEELVELGVGDGGWVLGGRGKEVDAADGAGERDDLDAEGVHHVLLGNSAGSDTGDGLAGTASATSTFRLDSVFRLGGEVGMAGSWVHVHGLVSVVCTPVSMSRQTTC